MVLDIGIWRQFIFESDNEYVGMFAVGLSVEFEGAATGDWPPASIWGYAGPRRSPADDAANPEVVSWAGHAREWAPQVEATRAFDAFRELQAVSFAVSASDV
jgi:hypothetical protein